MTKLQKGIGRVGEPGTVMVSAGLSVTPDEAWRALTEPDVVSNWFGNLTKPLAPGSSTRIDFEDGDFFDIFDVELEPKWRIHYRWSFLGTASPDSITWRILPQDIGCIVSVTDADSERSEEWIDILKAGWLDFVQRLADHTRTGQTTRYDWRREFDGTVDLSGPINDIWRSLFDNRRVSIWAPFLPAVVMDNAECRPNDGQEPAVTRLCKVSRRAPTELHFEIDHSQWNVPTSVKLHLHHKNQGARLSINHTGWELISCDPAYCRNQRKRFAALWTNALYLAKKVSASNFVESSVLTS